MTAPSPVVITSRLLAGIQVRDANGLAEVSIEPIGSRNGKPRWRVWIDLPDGSTHVDDSLHGWGDARAMLGTLCSFLYACAESRAYAARTGREGENADLFTDAVGAWAESVSDELAMIGMELEGGAS